MFSSTENIFVLGQPKRCTDLEEMIRMAKEKSMGSSVEEKFHEEIFWVFIQRDASKKNVSIQKSIFHNYLY